MRMQKLQTDNSTPETIAACTECGSWFLRSASKMRGLCPECASRLYGYETCAHEFRDGKCVKCLWDGSPSDFIKLLEEKHGTA